jgi:hypothetical protein
MKVYAWISDPHEGEPEPYPMSFVHPDLGVMAMYSTRRDLVESEAMRAVAEAHAKENHCTVRLVSATVDDTIDMITGVPGRAQ